MPWYFAGPDAKPVGPYSVQELHDRRISGVITADTYVIEHASVGTDGMAWKRYKEVFPTNLSPTTALPELPPTPAAPAAHPLFPSATVNPQAAQHINAMYRPTNGWCAWGFVLGLLGFFLSFFCVGLVLALPSLLLCIAGLVQVQKNPGQSGRGLAAAGLILSALAVLISLVIIASLAWPMWKNHELTVTEQTSNDSE